MKFQEHVMISCTPAEKARVRAEAAARSMPMATLFKTVFFTWLDNHEGETRPKKKSAS